MRSAFSLFTYKRDRSVIGTYIRLWLAGLMLLTSCSGGPSRPCLDGIKTPCFPKEEPHRLLSEYDLFAGKISDLEPVSGLLPFDLNTPLFSDYAQKLRFIYVPTGTSTPYNGSDFLEFPVGAILVKNFYYQKNLSTARADRELVETRLLMRRAEGWAAETYVWNEEQTDALLHRTGKTKALSWIDEDGIQRQAQYLIPSKNNCNSCHGKNGALVPLGPKARNLNKAYPFKYGEQNQLARWVEEGILESMPGLEEIPRVAVWDDASTGTLNERARIYLDVNCGSCHHPAGSANNTALFLNLEEQREFNLGIYKIPVSFGDGAEGLTYDIVPGQPDSSILIYRMESVEPQIRMPELGRSLVHREGVALIREWIEKLECESCR